MSATVDGSSARGGGACAEVLCPYDPPGEDMTSGQIGDRLC